MEEFNRVFIDSSFLVALFNERDALHKKATPIAKILKEKDYQIFISNFVFLETTTIVSQKLDRETAIFCGNLLLNSGEFKTIYIDEHLNNLSWDIFQEIKKKNMSFVDCSIIASMRFFNIKKLLTFDREDFTQLRRKYRFSFLK